MAGPLENEVAQLKAQVASLREEAEIVRKMWAADVDRLSIELTRARDSASSAKDSIRELFLELERMELAMTVERQRVSTLLEEKASQDAANKSLKLALAEEVDSRKELLEEKISAEARATIEAQSLESMLVQLMTDYERLEAIYRSAVDEVWSLKNAGVEGLSLVLSAENVARLKLQEITPSTPRSHHTDEEPELEQSVRSLEL